MLPYFTNQNSESKENETLLAIGTAYTQGEDIAGRGRVMLFSFRKKLENSQNLVNIAAFLCLKFRL